MAKQKKELVRPGGMREELMRRLQENSSTISSASQVMSTWRYLDFWNPKDDLPCISQEWLLGARGYLAGRIAQLRAKYSKGKSSYMYLQYAAAQKRAQAFCFHVETEGAGAPADYIASFGCDPNDLLVAEIPSLEECLQEIDQLICQVRGGFGGSVGEMGRAVKTKFNDPIDPDLTAPIVIGIDSLSSLGSQAGVNEDIADVSATAQLSWHTRKLREYFRTRVQRFRDAQALLMLTSHQTAKIETGKNRFGGGGGDDKSSLAQEVIGITATYGLDFEASKWWDKSTGTQVGDVIKITTFKNKLSPRYRALDMYLKTGQGFDLIKTDAEFLTKHPASPFAAMVDSNNKPVLYRHSQGITCRPLSDKSFKTDEEFIRAVYDNEDFIMGLREGMRIRGYGFKFEADFQQKLDEEELKASTDTPAMERTPLSESVTTTESDTSVDTTDTPADTPRRGRPRKQVEQPVSEA